MAVALSVVAGFVVGVAVWRLWAPRGDTALGRENFRGATVPTAGGVVVIVTVLVVEAVRALWGDAAGPARILTVLVVAAFGGLGLLDDLLGSGGDGRGFVGHVRALVGGRLTTGDIKLVCGYAVAMIGCSLVADDQVVQLLADAALVALAANLGNLLDRAPGRTLKATAIAFAALAAAVGLEPRLGGVAATVGAGLALLVPDLRERVMLGDTGANALGAALGFGVVLTCATGTRMVVLLVVLALNGLSELVSFSKVIDRVAPLRGIDRLGALPR